MPTLNGPMLVPLDGSETSGSILPYSITLAKALHLPVVLLRVVDPHSIELPHTPVGSAPAGALGSPGRRGFQLAQTQVIDQELEKARAELETVAMTFRELGVHAEVQAHEGTPADTILETARKVNACMVAMSTHGYTGLRRAMMGSVTDRVVHDGHLPMLVAHPMAGATMGQAHWRRVVLPLDGSAGAAEVGVPITTQVAKALGVPAHLGRIIPPPKVGMTGTPGDLTGAVELVKFAADDSLNKAEAYLQDIAARMSADGVKTDHFAAIGMPEDEIVKMAEPDTLLVMATHGRTGVARMVLGSVADRVMRTANSAVLLVPRTR